MTDTRTKYLEVPLSGKWMTHDPATIGQNFQTLENMRYTDTHIRSVQGMTKINTSAISTYLKARSAYHFRKFQPAESHVLAQGYDTDLAYSRVIENTTAIPSQGAFSGTDVFIDSNGAGRGYFSPAPNGQVAYCNGVDSCLWGGNEMEVSAFITSTAAIAADGEPTTPIDYTDKLQNTKSDASNVATIGPSALYYLVGSPRPLKGIKIYVSSANVSTSSQTGTYWDGSAWSALSLTDNTDTGAALAVTGTITFTSTVATAKPRFISGYFLYWYQFALSAGTATIYKVTLDAPFQGIIDLWDNVYRDISAAYKRTSSGLTDYTVKLLREDYDKDSDETYADLVGLSAYNSGNNCLEFGFTEKITGLHFRLPDAYTNSTASTTMNVDYFDGSAYQTVGDISDGTAEGGISFARSGTVTWNNASISGESKTSEISQGYQAFWPDKASGQVNQPLYFYRVRFDEALDMSTRLDYVGGITAPKTVSYYRFPLMAQGRLFLLCDMSGEKNKALVSAKYMPQVFNGDDTADLYFGDEGALNCGTEIFSQYGGNLYSLILIFKDTETWIVAGQDLEAWENNIYPISTTIGCPAPLTLKTVNLFTDPGAGLNRSLAIWQGARGVYMSDGRSPIPIHGDIAEYFDATDARCIRSSKVGDSVAWLDVANNEYHLKIASGSSATTLNVELVYDFKHNKWYKINRGTGNDLQCGVEVTDTDGNPYSYGFLDTGYMERLEYGNAFDGVAITSIFQTGDIAPMGLAYETRMSVADLITVAKATTTNSVTCTHYGNTASTGTSKTMSPANSGYRLAQPDWDEKLNGDPFHSLKCSMTTSDETICFEPLALVLAYHPVHQQ